MSHPLCVIIVKVFATWYFKCVYSYVTGISKRLLSLLPVALLWSTHCHHQAKQWPTPYISRMQ